MNSKFTKAMFVAAASMIGFSAMPQIASAQMFGPGFFPMAPVPVYMPPPPVYRGPMQPSPPIHPGRGMVYNAVGMNKEAQVGAECARRYGVSKAAAGCIVGRLTADEINKCFTHGIGDRGCFGDNNTLVSWASNNFAAAQREKNAADQAIRFGTGISPQAIREHGPLGGPNSDARKACDAVAGIFGGRC